MRLPLLAALILASLSFAPVPPGGTWKELGPHASGRVSAIAATDPNHIWAASPGGGVWKTADGGAHWAWAGNYGLGDFTVLDMAIDRNDEKRLFLRTWNGFFVSTDGGANWKQTLYSQGSSGDTSNFQPAFVCGAFPACPPSASPTLFEPRPFAQMVFSPRQSILLTGLPCGGLQYSTNAGASFAQLWPFPGAHPETNADNCIISIAADEVTHKIYFSAMGTGDHTKVFRSSAAWTASGPPAGLRWELVNRGFSTNEPATALAWGGSADRVMALVTDWSINPSHGTAYLFDGTTWTAKPFHNPECIMPEARELVWGGGNDFFAGGTTFGYTSNAGNTWNCPRFNQQYVDIRSIFPDRRLGRVWIGGDQSALEEHWVISSYPWTAGASIGTPTGSTGSGMSTWQTYSVAVAPAADRRNRILVGAQDVSAVCSDDDGVHWQLIPTDESQSLIWRHTGTMDVVYSYSTLGTLQKSTNAGSAVNCAAIKFNDVSPPDSLRESKASVGPHTIAVHPTDANKIYTISARSVIYSTNGGAHWARAAFSPAGHPRPPAPTAIFVDEAGMLYIGTLDGGAFVCNDAVHLCDGSAGSGAWTPWGLNGGAGGPAPRMITAITESNPPSAGRTFWMATSQGIYHKAGAGSWTTAGGVPGYAYSDVTVDPACHTRIYAAIGYMDPISRSRGGIDFSSDNGANWVSLTSGALLHNVPIVQVLASSGQVFATTYGRGAWQYDWGKSMPPCGR